ncbi:MAG TPA: hypothetical protein GX720_06300 [Clostridiaceae bacterium]|nr:hypothetical protein [Clostridiaceae bacterium]
MIAQSFIYLLAKADRLENAVVLIIKWGLILALLFAGLGLVGWLVSGWRKVIISGEIQKHGLKDVVIREVDRKVFDDTLANTIMGHEIAGNWGALLGAMSGSRQEYIRSVRFWIKLGNGEKREITLKPKDSLFKVLLAFLDNRDFDRW